MEMNEDTSNVVVEEQNLEDVMEDPESGESETVTEVEVSEKALKFKIATEGNLGTGRKSYPGSRKGSRERVHNFNSSDLNRVIQKGKLKTGALSFDQRCLVGNKKLSFDNPEFLDEYAIIFNKRHENISDDSHNETDSESYRFNTEECIVSKETLNLNKRNSEHSVKVPMNLDEKRSILKCPEKVKVTNLPVYSTGDQNFSKIESSSLEENIKLPEAESPIIKEPRRNSLFKTLARHSSLIKSSENAENIAIEKPDLNMSQVQSETDTTNGDSRNNRSILSRLKQLTDRFGLSVERDVKYKTSKFNPIKNNNSTKSVSKGKKKLDSPCCNSMENVDERRASTLPKTKKSSLTKRGWKFLVLGKEKSINSLEAWASDADMKLATLNVEPDNQSLPSTSHSQTNCSLEVSPKRENKGDSKIQATSGDSEQNTKMTTDGNKKIEPENKILDSKVVTSQLTKLQELRADQVLVACEQNNSTLI